MFFSISNKFRFVIKMDYVWIRIDTFMTHFHTCHKQDLVQLTVQQKKICLKMNFFFIENLVKKLMKACEMQSKCSVFKSWLWNHTAKLVKVWDLHSEANLYLKSTFCLFPKTNEPCSVKRWLCVSVKSFDPCQPVQFATCVQIVCDWLILCMAKDHSNDEKSLGFSVPYTKIIVHWSFTYDYLFTKQQNFTLVQIQSICRWQKKKWRKDWHLSEGQKTWWGKGKIGETSIFSFIPSVFYPVEIEINILSKFNLLSANHVNEVKSKHLLFVKPHHSIWKKDVVIKLLHKSNLDRFYCQFKGVLDWRSVVAPCYVG